MLGLWILEVGSVAAALHAPLWFFAWRRGQFSLIDVSIPYIAILLWSICTEFRIGSVASLANLIEVPIVVGLSLAAYGLRLTGAFGKNAAAGVITIFVVFASVILLRLLMPTLPE